MRKTYMKPSVQVERFDVKDIITVSPTNPTLYNNWNYNGKENITMNLNDNYLGSINYADFIK